MEGKKFLTTGEFARLCGTTRETMLHYDRKGLIKPKYIASNGYRVYGIEQYFDFDLICLLKEGGSTLEEIKQYRANEENSGYLNLLVKQISLLKTRHRKLEHRISMLTQLMKMATEAASTPFDTLFFEDRKISYVYYYKIESEKMTTRETCIECYSNFLLESLSCGNSIDLPLGYIVPQEYAINKYHKICYLFRNVYKDENIDVKKIKNGKYACMLHRGNMESHINVFYYMIDEIEKMNFKIMSDFYIYDQMSYILAGTSPEYIAKHIVKIE